MAITASDFQIWQTGGIQITVGAPGPSAVSANANNKATLGSDSLILVQGTAAGIAATTHAQTVSGDDPQLTNSRTPTAHQATHNAGTDAIPLASAAAQGLCPPVDNTTIQVSGGKLVAVGGGSAGVSTDANNKATLGSDSKILVQGTASGVAATTHAQTVSGDDPQLTNARTPTAHASTHNLGGSDVIAPDWTQVANKPSTFTPAAHQATHNGGSDPIPLVSAAAQGLCPPVDNTTIQVSGGKLVAAAQPNGKSSPVVLGESVADPFFTSGISVPRFANHPDAIWTYGTFDDHFDGSSLNAKWALTTSGAAHPLSFLTNAVAASKFSLGGVSGANDNNSYQAYAIQTLPNANSFTITIRVDLLLACALGANSQGSVTFRLYNGTANVGLDTTFLNAYSAGAAIPINLINFLGGTSMATVIQQLGTGKPPQYVRLVWSTTNASITAYASEDGASWIWLTVVSSAQSGFTTSNPPLNFWLLVSAVNSGRVMFHVDWVKFTNP